MTANTSKTTTADEAVARASRQLQAADRIWIGTHVDPDGDAVGSALGLAHILHHLGKSVTVACQDHPPDQVAFLPQVDRITTVGPEGHDLAVAVDAADTGRLGDLYEPGVWSSMPTLVVDHHISNPAFADVNVIDPGAASTAEIVVRIADALAVRPDPAAATCLLTGIVTDTLGFRTSNTSAETLDCARRLMRWGAPLADINQQVFYRKPVAALRLIGRAIERLETHGPFAVSTLSQADIAEVGATPDAARGVSSLLATVAEPTVVALLRERRDGTVDVSLRSRPGVDVGPAAAALGGGGHPQASGATVPGPLSEAKAAVLGALSASLGAGTPSAPGDA